MEHRRNPFTTRTSDLNLDLFVLLEFRDDFITGSAFRENVVNHISGKRRMKLMNGGSARKGRFLTIWKGTTLARHTPNGSTNPRCTFGAFLSLRLGVRRNDGRNPTPRVQYSPRHEEHRQSKHHLMKIGAHTLVRDQVRGAERHPHDREPPLRLIHRLTFWFRILGFCRDPDATGLAEAINRLRPKTPCAMASSFSAMKEFPANGKAGTSISLVSFLLHVPHPYRSHATSRIPSMKASPTKKPP